MSTGEIYQARDKCDLVMQSRMFNPHLVVGSHTQALTLSRMTEKATGGVKNHKLDPEAWAGGQGMKISRKDEMVQPYSEIWGRDRKTWVPGIRMQTINPVLQASWHMGMCWMELLGDTVPTKSTSTQVRRSRKMMRTEGPTWWAMRREFVRIR